MHTVFAACFTVMFSFLYSSIRKNALQILLLNQNSITPGPQNNHTKWLYNDFICFVRLRQCGSLGCGPPTSYPLTLTLTLNRVIFSLPFTCDGQQLDFFDTHIDKFGEKNLTSPSPSPSFLRFLLPCLHPKKLSTEWYSVCLNGSQLQQGVGYSRCWFSSLAALFFRRSINWLVTLCTWMVVVGQQQCGTGCHFPHTYLHAFLHGFRGISGIIWRVKSMQLYHILRWCTHNILHTFFRVTLMHAYAVNWDVWLILKLWKELKNNGNYTITSSTIFERLVASSFKLETLHREDCKLNSQLFLDLWWYCDQESNVGLQLMINLIDNILLCWYSGQLVG